MDPTPGRGLVTRETALVIRERAGTFSPTPRPPEWRKGLEVEPVANSQLFNQSYLCSEASIKTQKVGF